VTDYYVDQWQVQQLLSEVEGCVLQYVPQAFLP